MAHFNRRRRGLDSLARRVSVVRRLATAFAVASVLAVGLVWWLPLAVIDCTIFWYTIECWFAS